MSKFKIAMIGSSLEQNGGIATFEKLMLKYPSPDIDTQHIASHIDGSIIQKIWVFERSLAKLTLRLLSRQTDIVHINISDGGSLLRKAIILLLSYMFHKPVVIHAHGYKFHITFSNLHVWLQQIISWIFRRCHTFIVLSQRWKEYYINSLGLEENKVIIVPNPAELPIQVPNRKGATKIKLGFFGRVGERKGTFDLIRAFAKLPNSVKCSSQLIIAGDGNIEQGRKLVESFNLTEYVTFLGWIDAQTRDRLLAKVDVFVLPSYNEGLPMALLEAMAWGLPVVVTPVGGIDELITPNKNGLLVTPGDIQQLSATMELLINNEDLRLSLGNAARQTATAFDVKNYCSLLAQIYQSVLE